MDDAGHGTHVAGTVAAAAAGVGVVGVVPDVSLYALKTLNASGSGAWSDAIAALEWAVDNGIQVTNNSYGSDRNPGSLVEDAFAISAAAGIVHVAAAGNAGNCGGKGNKVGYPARYASVIAVGATTKSNGRPCFLSTGPDVELAGPGAGINSTLVDGGYGEKSGTSMASPHVAGAAALVIAAGMGMIDPAQVREILTTTAEDLGAPGRDTSFGFGLVDVAAAAATAEAAAGPPPPVGVTLTTDKSSYVEEDDTVVVLTAVVVNAAGGPITGLVREHFETFLNVESAVLGSPGFTETVEAGVYTADLTPLPEPEAFTVLVRVNVDAGQGEDTADFSVSAASAGGTVGIDSITYSTSGGGKKRDKNLSIVVHAINDQGASVSGAVVSISVELDGNPYGTATGTTGSDGTARFVANRAPSGPYTTTVDDVTASGLTWDGNGTPEGYEFFKP